MKNDKKENRIAKRRKRMKCKISSKMRKMMRKRVTMT
jgi:hypothetical protein